MIRIAKTAGFCFGVRNAIKISEKAAAEKMLAGLKECVTPIDGLIAFAGSPNGEKILGKDAWHCLIAFRPRCLHASVTDQNVIVGVDHRWRDKSELAKACSKLRDLFLAVCSCIPCIRHQLVDRYLL